MSRMRLLTALILGCAIGQLAVAQTSSRKTKLTFSGPVQLPAPNTSAGVITLPPGTYMFRLVNSQASRNIVEVSNESGDKVYTRILAIPDYRVNASSKTVMYFTERAANAPVAVKSWFYPGDNFGQRFVYPKVKAVELAAEVKEPVPSYVPPAAPTAPPPPVVIQTPQKQETQYTAQAFAATDAKDTEGVNGEPVAASAPLPKTASPIYTAGLIGLLLLGLGLTARRVRRTFGSL
jgi:hypothetical protein